MVEDSRVGTVVHSMAVVLSMVVVPNTVGGRSTVGHSTVSLGTVSLGTVSLGTVSLGTVSLGTVSPDTEEDTAVLGEPTEEPHRRVEWAWVVRWRWEEVLSSVVLYLGRRLE
jgi:hypothetical protein